MKLYRKSNYWELLYILSGMPKEGYFSEKVRGKNSFNYEKGKSYIHFFPDPFIIDLTFSRGDFNVEYDIPNKMLAQNYGTGWHYPQIETTRVPEFRLQRNQINMKEHITRILLGNDRTWFGQKQFDDSNYKNYLQTLRDELEEKYCCRANNLPLEEIIIRTLNTINGNSEIAKTFLGFQELAYPMISYEKSKEYFAIVYETLHQVNERLIYITSLGEYNITIFKEIEQLQKILSELIGCNSNKSLFSRMNLYDEMSSKLAIFSKYYKGKKEENRDLVQLALSDKDMCSRCSFEVKIEETQTGYIPEYIAYKSNPIISTNDNYILMQYLSNIIVDRYNEIFDIINSLYSGKTGYNLQKLIKPKVLNN